MHSIKLPSSIRTAVTETFANSCLYGIIDAFVDGHARPGGEVAQVDASTVVVFNCLTG